MKTSRSYVLIFLLMVMGIITAQSSTKDWDSKCNRCRCNWKSSKRWTDCSNTSQVGIPNDLHTDVQVLDLSDNNIAEIQKNHLYNHNLHNLHKLMIVNCTLIQVDRDAFSGLSILIELDLSVNQIKVIHPGTFHPLIKIRKIILHHNEIEAISDRTFENLQYLSIVELQHNRISTIGEQAFLNVPLKVIYLANNRLQKLDKTTFMSLTVLTELTLSDNFWNCSCELKDFRSYVIEKKLSTDTKCHHPNGLKDRLWSDLNEEEFSCSPRIIVPRGVASFKATKGNETLVCQVKGTPRPTIEWHFGARLIRSNDHHYHVRTFEVLPKTTPRKDEHLKHVVSELTIVTLRASDRGKYSCKATNIGGSDEVAMTLEISAESLSPTGIFEPQSSNTLFMILCIIVVILIFMLAVVVCLCCYCRRMNKYDKKPSSDNTLLMSQQNGPTTKLNGKSQSESILDGGSVIMELQKNLLTEVNPVEKPPRRTEVDSIEKDGDDVSDLKQTLLDETTPYGQTEDETRSIQLSDSTHTRSRQAFIEDSYSANLLPPDLLAFPRFPQSPSLQSSISNIHEPRIYARSPLTSPVYGETTIPSGFRTLQHPKTGRTLAVATSRSNSPFIPAPILYPQPMMKQGYVTIPRKQRTGSWAPSIASDYQTSSPSSPPPQSQQIEICEPVYDNLGLRTTAAGNSSLNLNKLPGSLKNGTLPSPGANLKYSMKDRPLPATPLGDHKKIMNGSLREPLYSSATLEKKVPPRPPPKPKKKPLLDENSMIISQQLVIPIQHRITTNGRHIEEECEDGTEV